MDLPDRTDRPDRSPALAELLDDAYATALDVDTASRHLWAIHTEAARLEAGRQDPAAPDATGAPDDPAPAAPRRELVGAASGGLRGIPRAAVPIVALVMVMSSSGVALAASQSSLPGDVLYPVKRGTEQVQLIFARDPQSRAQLQLAFAQNRMEEIRRIAATRPQHVPALVAAINVTLQEARTAAPEDSDRFRAEIDAEIAALDIPPAQVSTPTGAQDVASGPTAAAATTTPVPSTSAPDATGTPASAPSAPATTGSTDVPSAAPTPTATPSTSPTPGPVTGGDVAVVDGGSGTPRPSAGPVTPPTTTAGPGTTPTPTTSPTPTPTPTTGTDDRSGEDDDGPSPQPSPQPEPQPAPTVPPRPTPRPIEAVAELAEPFRPSTQPGHAADAASSPSADAGASSDDPAEG